MFSLAVARGYKEDVTDGLENAPRELIGLLKGQSFGKKIIRVSPRGGQG